MTTHSRTRKAGIGLMLGLALALGGCWDDDDDDNGAAAAEGEVPASAAASSASFVDFIRSLDDNDETSQPLLIPEGFEPPADADGEPEPLS